MAPEGRNPALAQSIISLVSSSIFFPDSESSVDTHTGNSLPARVLAVCKHTHTSVYTLTHTGVQTVEKNTKL